MILRKHNTRSIRINATIMFSKHMSIRGNMFSTFVSTFLLKTKLFVATITFWVYMRIREKWKAKTLSRIGSFKHVDTDKISLEKQRSYIQHTFFLSEFGAKIYRDIYSLDTRHSKFSKLHIFTLQWKYEIIETSIR